MRLYIGLDDFSPDAPTSEYLSAVNRLLSQTWNLDSTSIEVLTAHVDRCRIYGASALKLWVDTDTGLASTKVAIRLEPLPDNWNMPSADLADGSTPTASSTAPGSDLFSTLLETTGEPK